MPLRLPQALETFLVAGRQLEYDASRCEAGRVRLRSLKQLRLKNFTLSPDKTLEAPTDPHAGEDGYYLVPGVSLVARCKGYRPEGILLWLPGEWCFAYWDDDHHEIRRFPQATWAEIVADPVRHINAQWGYSDTALAVPVSAFGKYPFRPD